jgi:arabinose-5-phosphate isomerase
MTDIQPVGADLSEAEAADAKELIRREALTVALVADQLGASLGGLANLIGQLTGKVITSGLGTSGTVARRLAHLLTVTGTPAFFLSPSDGLHGSSAVGVPGDMLIAISKAGESDELIEMAGIMKSRGVKIVAMCASDDNPLARAADFVAVVEAGASDPGGIVAMGITLAQGAYGDALALLLMGRKGYRWSQVVQSHPGGGVGKHGEDLVRAAEGGQPAPSS